MIRYSKLGYVALNVSDLGRAHDWYASMMGLQFNGARAHRVFPARPESFDSTGSTRDGRMAAAGDIEPGL